MDVVKEKNGGGAPAVETEARAAHKKPRWKSIVNIASYFVIIFGIVFGLPKFLTWSLNTPYPMAAITSGSMWPALKQGDLVFVQGVSKKEDVAIGDVVVYKNNINNTFTIHRITTLNADTFVTKGDANFTEDAPAPYKDLVGKNVMVFNMPVRIPYLGFVTMYATNLRNQEGYK